MTQKIGVGVGAGLVVPQESARGTAELVVPLRDSAELDDFVAAGRLQLGEQVRVVKSCADAHDLGAGAHPRQHLAEEPLGYLLAHGVRVGVLHRAVDVVKDDQIGAVARQRARRADGEERAARLQRPAPGGLGVV